MHEIDIWSFPRGHQDDDVRKEGRNERKLYRLIQHKLITIYERQWPESGRKRESWLNSLPNGRRPIDYSRSLDSTSQQLVRVSRGTRREEKRADRFADWFVIIGQHLSTRERETQNEFFAGSSNQMKWIKSNVHREKKMNIIISHLIRFLVYWRRTVRSTRQREDRKAAMFTFSSWKMSSQLRRRT